LQHLSIKLQITYGEEKYFLLSHFHWIDSKWRGSGAWEFVRGQNV